GLTRHQLERGLAVRRLEDLVALGGEAHAQELADGRLIVDHQHLDRGGAHAAVSSGLASAATGSRMGNTAPPRPVRVAAVMVPGIASMNPREIASPSPVPART